MGEEHLTSNNGQAAIVKRRPRFVDAGVEKSLGIVVEKRPRRQRT